MISNGTAVKMEPLAQPKSEQGFRTVNPVLILHVKNYSSVRTASCSACSVFELFGQNELFGPVSCLGNTPYANTNCLVCYIPYVDKIFKFLLFAGPKSPKVEQ